MSDAPLVVVIGGPNGAGKSTIADAVVRQGYGITEFVNADTIARGLSAFDPEGAAFAAGRLMLERLDELAKEHADFAFESTLSSRSFAPWLEKRKREGYRLDLHYVVVFDPQTSIDRVGLRVRSGGHSVPPEVVRRRWARSVGNLFALYLPIADRWTLHDATGPTVPFARGEGGQRVVYDEEAWERLQQLRATHGGR